MDAVAESWRKERNPRVSTGCSLGVGGEWVGWRVTGRPYLSRENKILRRERGQEKNNFPCSADDDQDGRNHTQLVHTLLRVLAIHTYYT